MLDGTGAELGVPVMRLLSETQKRDVETWLGPGRCEGGRI